MNLSTLRDIFVNQALGILGHGNPAYPRSHLPALTNQDVLGRLSTLPDLTTRVKNLQDEQDNFKPANDTDRELKVFCRNAGQRLVRACTISEDLRCLLGSDSQDAAFSRHQHLIDCLLQIKESLAFWEESNGAEEFSLRHARPDEVRSKYMEHTLRLVTVIVDLTFSEDLRPYVQELQDVLERPHLRGQLFLDSAVTYAQTKKRVRVGLTAPHNRHPKRFIPFGLKKLTPFWYRNPYLYGHLQVPNELCIKQRKGALPEGAMELTLTSGDGLTDKCKQLLHRHT